MSKFNKQVPVVPVMSTKATVLTAERGVGYAMESKTELFNLGVANFVSGDTFYESGKGRDSRFNSLIAEVTKSDPQWVREFLVWLRNEANMRSASVVGVAEYIRAGGEQGRTLVRDVLARADEPAELLAYWTSKYGRKLPAALKRGVADAAIKLYNQYTIGKYDTNSRAWRFADVISVTHPKPKTDFQRDLFKYALERRYNSDAVAPESLTTMSASDALSDRVKAEGTANITAEDLKAAGWTWERLSGYGPINWDKIIPSMGYMALLRNLRNFDQFGITDESYNYVVTKLGDPDEVARSRQLPFRFYSAYKNSSVRWHPVLEKGLRLSFNNVPELDGKTLVLIDVSGSMTGLPYGSRHSSITPAENAALFGQIAAHRWGADIAVFGTSSQRIKLTKGDSVINKINEIARMGNVVGHGTAINAAINKQWDGHDRVVTMTDMQTGDRYLGNKAKFNYAFNLNGHGASSVNTSKSGNFLLAGLTDHTFKMMPQLEAGKTGQWPWESK